jgi:trk system potassium uptake protein
VKDAELTPRITETAKALWLVYAGITVACIASLILVGMPPFDAVCHAFSAMSLGGFSTHDASVAYFHSQAIEVVLMIFLVIAAMNFSTHFVAIRRGDLGAYRRDPESRWVVIWLAVSILVLTAVVHHAGQYESYGDALRHVAFMTISMATTTGFVTADYSYWPVFASMWMLILIKQFFREMFLLVHPQAVAPLRIGGQVVPSRIAFSVLAFIFVYFMSIVVMTFALLLTGMDFVSAFTATISSINNTVPSLGVVGPAHNYAGLSDAQTWVCTLAMFLGRIELFTFLVLFTRTFWRK